MTIYNKVSIARAIFIISTIVTIFYYDISIAANLCQVTTTNNLIGRSASEEVGPITFTFDPGTNFDGLWFYMDLPSVVTIADDSPWGVPGTSRVTIDNPSGDMTISGLKINTSNYSGFAIWTAFASKNDRLTFIGESCIARIDLGVTITQNERNALVALYNNTNGDQWYNNSWWKSPPLHLDGFSMPGTECSWWGVYCSADGVNYIDLWENNLLGTIPSEVDNLSKLTVFSLGVNQLTGSIPPELGNLSNLRVLMLYENQLTGNVPPELGNLSELKRLSLRDNKLTGNIPSELGQLFYLWELSLENNSLFGNIPIDFINLINLQFLYICGNNLHINDRDLDDFLSSRLTSSWEDCQITTQLADMNFDGDVDVLYLNVFSVVYSNSIYPDADTNGDGLIDANDVHRFAYEYGKTSIEGSSLNVSSSFTALPKAGISTR